MSPKPLGVHDLMTATTRATLPTLRCFLIELRGVEDATVSVLPSPSATPV